MDGHRSIVRGKFGNSGKFVACCVPFLPPARLSKRNCRVISRISGESNGRPSSNSCECARIRFATMFVVSYQSRKRESFLFHSRHRSNRNSILEFPSKEYNRGINGFSSARVEWKRGEDRQIMACVKAQRAYLCRRI